jgi:prepilin-type N-terminal cleavage/methylation domain-containing protein
MKRIHNLQFTIYNTEKGYTLIELLITIAILATVGAIMVSILISTFRSSNKSQAISDLRQNGNYAISQMSKSIGFAKSFDGAKVNSGDVYTTTCPVSGSPQYKYLQVTSFDNGATVFSCSAGTIASNSSSLIDTTSISVTNCFFTCSQPDASAPPTIDINFILNKINGGGLSENAGSVPFQTSVTVMNY